MNTVDNKYQAILGSDEAGKGEWLGPMTVAAVALTPEQSSYLVTQGVMDSKELNDETIEILSKVIVKTCLSYYVVSIAPKRFNELLRDVKKEGRSLNDILAWEHAKAISQVYQELKRKGISRKIRLVIDEFDRLKTEERLKRVLELKEFDFVQSPRAEEETAVAAAGIMARATRESWISEASRRLNVNLRKLSATEAFIHKDVEYFAKVSFLEHK